MTLPMEGIESLRQLWKQQFDSFFNFLVRRKLLVQWYEAVVDEIVRPKVYVSVTLQTPWSKKDTARLFIDRQRCCREEH